MATLARGDVVEYHGRRVEIVDPPQEVRAPISGDVLTMVRVRDPRRGLRTMLLWQLEAGIGAAPEKVFAEPDESFR